MTVIRGQHVLVTGASRGLGRELALRLAREGARISLAARDQAALDAVAAEIRAEGGVAAAIPVDLAVPGEPARLATAAHDALGPPGIVVHNAGIEPFVAFEEADPETIDRVLAVNLGAVVQLTRAVVPGMLARGSGHLVFMGSTSGLFAAPWAATYGATKAAVASLSRSLAVEYADRGVRCTVVEPGFVVGTGMFEDHRRGKGLVPPRIFGTTTAEAVVDAVVDALLHDRPDVVVNSVPVGPAAAFGRLAPSVGIAAMRRFMAPFLRRLASTR